MPTYEIDETEFLANKQLRKTIEGLMANPKAAKLVETALKEIDPNAKTPRLDAERPLQEAVETVTKKFDEWEKKQADKEAEAEKKRQIEQLESKWEAGRSKLRAANYTDEGIKAVEDLMSKHNIIDHEIALSHFERLHPPQSPVTPSNQGFLGVFDAPKESEDTFKKLFESRGENGQVVNDMVHQALAEVRGQSRR